jgi:alpha-tubulin suppressor-like RCC1 family protein
VQIGALTNWILVAAAENGRFTLSIKTDGTLWSWGKNDAGQLGLGNTTNYSSPKQIGILTNWSTVTATHGATAAVKTDGTLWTWGAGISGQLGLGNITYYSSPKQVGSLTSWLSVSAGAYNILANTQT